MARFFAFQGVGYLGRPNSIGDAPKAWRKWPYAVIQGPSGQLVQLEPPSGFAGKIPDTDTIAAWHSNECSMNHSCVAWKHRRIVFIWSDSLNTAGSMRCYAWNPQPQQARKINPTGNQTVDTNTQIKNIVVADGHHWELWNVQNDSRDHAVMMPVYDGVFWVKRFSDIATHFGIYKGKIPYKVPAASGYFWASAGNYGNTGDAEDAGWSRLPNSNGAGGQVQIQDGVTFTTGNGLYPGNISHNMCEMVRHNDTFYIISQESIQAMTIGCKGNYLHHDFGKDDKVAVGSVTGYTSRRQTGVLGATERSACVHNDKVWMLTNNGRVFELRPGGPIQKADLSTIGTPWGSGIAGGQLNRTPNTGDWPGASNFRPLLRSFNGQLHAFLNFNTTYKIANGKGNATSKTHGAGVCWFTSFDGVNWQDHSEMLPASGIITPSGNRMPLASWKAITHPYVHSAYTNTHYPSGYGPKAPKTNFLGQSAPKTQGAEARPSGFKQASFLPFWSSGNLLDVDGTKFNLLKTPLSRGMLSGCLFPTFVSYPSGYAFVNPNGGDASGFRTSINGVWRPVHGNGSKIGASGWDYSCCSNYHIEGWTDNDIPGSPILHLYFSRNFNGSTPVSTNRQVPTLFYNLTKESGFMQVNEAWNAGQLNGICPIELFDPEVIIPSGDIYNPNPRIDTVRRLAKIDFVTTDWFFWESVKIKTEYSTDGGQSWNAASMSGTTTGLSTGTHLTDPSGVGVAAAQKHTIYWKYGEDLGLAQYPRVQMRMRAEI